LAVDVITPMQASDPAVLARYRVVALFGEAQGLVDPEMVAALVRHAEAGGTAVVGPLAGYVSEEGVVGQSGLAEALRPLTGVTVPIFRWLGDGSVRVTGPDGELPVLHGLVEASTDLPEGMEISARLVSEDAAWNGRPAVLRRALGAGVVWKYLATPDAGPASSAWAGLPERHALLAECLPADVLGVPREDGSLILVNMANEVRQVALTNPVRERFSGREVSKMFEMTSQMVAWAG
jgi:beta-galactosidase GanA